MSSQPQPHTKPNPKPSPKRGGGRRGASPAAAGVMTDGVGQMPMLALQGVGKTYQAQGREATVAVAGVDVSIDAGEFISVVGPSGCGKTTLMKMCAGLVEPTTGRIDYRGTGKSVAAGESGIVFQTASLLPWRTIVDNVLLPADLLKLDKRKATERAHDLLSLVKLDGAADKYPGELSGGMQQRASICRALLHDPALLFMDEPFGALDAMTRDELNMELQTVHMREHKTVVFITHSITEAVLLADRVLVMSTGPGRVVADLPVSFPRPRGLDLVGDPDFGHLTTHIRELLHPAEVAGEEEQR
jgi:NitT/TauT family transport system ATP-binding protein